MANAINLPKHTQDIQIKPHDICPFYI